MGKISYLKIVVVIVFVLIVVDIGYAGWKNWNSSNEVKNQRNNLAQQQDRQAKSVENKNSEVPKFDTLDWKTYQNIKYNFVMKYPSELSLEGKTLKYYDEYNIFRKKDFVFTVSIISHVLAEKYTKDSFGGELIDNAGVSLEKWNKEREILLTGKDNQDCTQNVFVVGSCKVEYNQNSPFLVAYSFFPTGGNFKKIYTYYTDVYRYDIALDLNFPMEKIENLGGVKKFLSNLSDKNDAAYNLGEDMKKRIDMFDLIASTISIRRSK
jgi:hypothetical protein